MLPIAAIILLALTACTPPEEGQIVVSINGSVSSLVTTIPEATTTTTPEQQTTTTVPGADPGACSAPGEIVIVPLVEDIQAQSPCAVSTTGMIRFSNLTDTDVTVEWGTRELRVPPQRSVVPPETVGEVLTPGLHAFVTSLDSVPTILIAAPEESFGSATVSLRSFGGVRPGQRVSEAEDALGLPIVVMTRGAKCSLGWIAGDPHSPLLSLAAAEADPMILRAAATTRNQLTISNVGIGSTADAVRAAYGNQLVERVDPDTDLTQLVFEPNEAVDANYRLIFDLGTENGESTVAAMRIGKIGEVERPEPCPS